MNENWSEIVEIMHPVLESERSHTEIMMALQSSLRTLGWRTYNGPMRTNFISKSGITIDIVLGWKEKDGTFHAALPIQVKQDKTEEYTIDIIQKIMFALNVRIAIVAGKTLDLYYKENDSSMAFRIGQISFELDDEEGYHLSHLLSEDEFDESKLNSFWETLYRTKLPAMKLDALLHSITEDNSKTEEVLRTFLELEGFTGKIVDEALENVSINIFYKNGTRSETTTEHTTRNTQGQLRTGHDNTRFSLNGGPYLTKRKFVLSVVRQYIKDNPNITLEDLEQRFPSEIASKARGVVRTWAQVKTWAATNGPDIYSRYCTKDNERIILHDGTEIVVNSQWRSRNFPRFLAIAKSLYIVKSDAPYEEEDCIEMTTPVSSNRAKDFKFSMVGIKLGEIIVFDATKTEVKVVSDDSIEYKGYNYRLSTFVRTFLPDNMKNSSESYRGPDYFSYKGETLTNLRNRIANEQLTQPTEDRIEEKDKSIHISLHSYNSFKTRK